METIESILNFIIENKQFFGFFAGIAIVILLIPPSEVRADFEETQSTSDLSNIYQALHYRELKMSQMTEKERLEELSNSGCITSDSIESMKQFPETLEALRYLDLKMSQQTQKEQYGTLKKHFGGNR